MSLLVFSASLATTLSVNDNVLLAAVVGDEVLLNDMVLDSTVVADGETVKRAVTDNVAEDMRLNVGVSVGVDVWDSFNVFVAVGDGEDDAIRYSSRNDHRRCRRDLDAENVGGGVGCV